MNYDFLRKNINKIHMSYKCNSSNYKGILYVMIQRYNFKYSHNIGFNDILSGINVITKMFDLSLDKQSIAELICAIQAQIIVSSSLMNLHYA